MVSTALLLYPMPPSSNQECIKILSNTFWIYLSETIVIYIKVPICLKNLATCKQILICMKIFWTHFESETIIIYILVWIIPLLSENLTTCKPILRSKKILCNTFWMYLSETIVIYILVWIIPLLSENLPTCKPILRSKKILCKTFWIYLSETISSSLGKRMDLDLSWIVKITYHGLQRPKSSSSPQELLNAFLKL